MAATGVGDVTGVNNYAYSKTVNAKDSSGVSMQDFLMLMVAQLQNQDMNNTVDNGQFMAQMAQIASMQAIQELSAVFKSTAAVNYIGKYVKAEAVVEITDYDSKGNATKRFEKIASEGVATRVSYNEGDTMVLVNDIWFKMSDIYQVMAEKPAEKTPEEND